MKTLLPHPLLSVLILLSWALLLNSLAPGVLLLGAVLAWLLPLLTRRFWHQPVSVSRPLALALYVLRLTGDIITANIAVARLILGPMRRIEPRFFRYPLRLRDEFAITVLANTISLTPGTVTSDVSQDRHWLLVHALDAEDTEAMIETIYQRYERPLLAIFENREAPPQDPATADEESP